MIRVLIAEDEPPTLRRIRRMIEESGRPFAVVATAADGEAALDCLAQTPCDVVFSDIRMPVMDGLALMDRVQARYPDCIVVIISGYQDFAYVSHAIRAKALDYLLKPVAQADMDALLARIEETHAQRARARLSRQLAATINRAEVPAPDADAVPEAARFHVCLLCAGPLPITVEGGPYPGEGAFDALPLEEAFAGVFPSHQGFLWAFMGNTEVERILIFQAPDGPIDGIAAALRIAIEERAGLPISCVYTRERIAMPVIGTAIRALRDQLAAGVRIGEGYLSPADPNLSTAPGGGAPDVQAVLSMTQWLRQGASPEDFAWVDLRAGMEAEMWTQQQVYRLLLAALTQLDADMATRHLLAEIVEGATSLDVLAAGLAGLASLLGDEGEQEAEHSVAAQVEAYLQAHYAGHINNQTLGQAFGYVPSYISLLFRRAYGVSPSDYLTQVRLERAKALMRAAPQMLIRDVAEQVGFKSPHHFSRTFKKVEGMWPTDFPR